ncbi:MAG: PHP domain-containing protein [Candidatus Woesearchaeota archaeon]
MIDLHMHTNHSDGELTPEELVDLAVAKGLKAMAITDHDTIGACQIAREYAQDKGIEVISGIEISCNEKEKGLVEIHVLGLFVDYNHLGLIEFSERVKLARIEQKRKMIEKLQGFGFEINFDEVEKLVGGSFGRPHVARVLMQKYPEQFPDMRNVFDKYLGNNKPGYVTREGYLTIKEAIELIKAAGGVAILAHPGVYEEMEKAKQLLDYFVSQKGDGLETYYFYDLICGLSNDEAEKRNKYFREYAQEHYLLQSGGSDFHGKKRNTLLPGELNIPDSVLEKMKEKLGVK